VSKSEGFYNLIKKIYGCQTQKTHSFEDLIRI